MSGVIAAVDGEIHPMSDRDQVSTVVKALVRVFDSWEATNAEAAALIDVPSATWGRMKSGTFNGSLDRDKVTRASLLIGIYKGLRLLFNGPLQAGWPRLKNRGAPYEGRSPIEYMIVGGIPAMDQVRSHIDALRGGV